eukprot:9094034-Ditylum_brightwellii.AAC.1
MSLLRSLYVQGAEMPPRRSEHTSKGHNMELQKVTGTKDYLGTYNSTDSQVDFKNYFGCDVPPAVMNAEI